VPLRISRLLIFTTFFIDEDSFLVVGFIKQDQSLTDKPHETRSIHRKVKRAFVIGVILNLFQRYRGCVARKKKINTLPFSAKLTRIMRERHLTLKQVSEMANVPLSTVSDWTSNTTPQDLIAVGRLARSLGVSLRELLLNESEEAKTVVNLADLFDEEDFFDDICRVSIRRLRLKK